MKIIIIGAGKAGSKLIEVMTKEEHDVIAIDKSLRKCKEVQKRYDILTIEGNGYSSKTLKEAGIGEADLLFALTQNDEVNMICCLTAKNLGAKKVIARIRDEEYSKELSEIKDEMKIDHVINPDKLCAEDISKKLSIPTAKNVSSLAKGKVSMIKLLVSKDSPFANRSLSDLNLNAKYSVILVAVVRDEESFIAKGNTFIQEGDEIYLMGPTSNITNLLYDLEIREKKIKRVVILGGSRTSVFLARMLKEDMKMKVKIIDNSLARCEELAAKLPFIEIIHATGADEHSYIDEKVEEYDAFISLTGFDELNFISALKAAEQGVSKIIVKMNKIDLKKSTLSKVGIDTIVNTRDIIANNLVTYVRGVDVTSVQNIIDDKTEIIEFEVSKEYSFVGKPISSSLKNMNSIIGFIIRNNEIIVPTGDSIIEVGDTIIIITQEIHKKANQIKSIMDKGALNEL